MWVKGVSKNSVGNNSRQDIMQPNRMPPPWYIGAGTFILGLLNLFSKPAQGVPPLLAYGLVAMFVITGIVMMLWSFGVPNAEKWLGRLIAAGIAGAFTWAGFFAGDDVQCSITTTIAGMSSSSSEGACDKTPFMVLAVLADLYVVYILIYELKNFLARGKPG